MRYSSRFFLYGPLVLAAILFTAAGLNWWQSASRLSAWLQNANGREILPGVHFAFAQKSISGFPFSLDTKLSNVRLRITTPSGGTVWTAEHFAFHRLTYGRDEAIFEAAGRQDLRWKTGQLDFAVGALRASAILEKGALVRFDLDVQGLGSKAFTAQRLQAHAKRAGSRITIITTMEGLSRCKSRSRFSAELSHAQALLPLLSGEQSLAAGLTAWRKADGKSRTEPVLNLTAEAVTEPQALASAYCG